jgi:hypothetical protein
VLGQRVHDRLPMINARIAKLMHKDILVPVAPGAIMRRWRVERVSKLTATRA